MKHGVPGFSSGGRGQLLTIHSNKEKAAALRLAARFALECVGEIVIIY